MYLVFNRWGYNPFFVARLFWQGLSSSLEWCVYLSFGLFDLIFDQIVHLQSWHLELKFVPQWRLSPLCIVISDVTTGEKEIVEDTPYFCANWESNLSTSYFARHSGRLTMNVERSKAEAWAWRLIQKRSKKGKRKEIVLCAALSKALWNNRQLVYEKAFRLGKPDTFLKRIFQSLRANRVAPWKTII